MPHSAASDRVEGSRAPGPSRPEAIWPLMASQILWVMRSGACASCVMAINWFGVFAGNWIFLVDQSCGRVEANPGATLMYVPPAFRVDDLAAMHGTMREARLASLVTATARGLVATPLPLILAAEEGPYGTLYGHVARANPQWNLPPMGDAMAMFMGLDAYISPSWYPSKIEHHKVVPTWNYVAVHA